MAKRLLDESVEFSYFKNEWLSFLLEAIREFRRAFEAAAASRWIAFLVISSVTLGAHASWWYLFR